MPIYKDNALNRCLKRVGKSWGGGKAKAVGTKKKGKKVFSDDVSDVKTKAPTIKKGTKITPKFGDTAPKKKRGRGLGFTRTKMVGKSAPAYDKGEKRVAGRGNTTRSGRGQRGKEKGGLVAHHLKNKGNIMKNYKERPFKPTLANISERMRKQRSDKGKKRGKKGVMKYEHL